MWLHDVAGAAKGGGLSSETWAFNSTHSDSPCGRRRIARVQLRLRRSLSGDIGMPCEVQRAWMVLERTAADGRCTSTPTTHCAMAASARHHFGAGVVGVGRWQVARRRVLFWSFLFRPAAQPYVLCVPTSHSQAALSLFAPTWKTPSGSCISHPLCRRRIPTLS